MSFLPKIIAFLIVAILLVIIAGFIISRFFIKKEIRDNESLSTLLPESLSRPARVHLIRSHAYTPGEKMTQLWREFDLMGFMILADYSESHNVVANIRLAGHPALKIGLILVEEEDGGAYGVVMATTNSHRIEARGNGLKTDLSFGMVRWIMRKDYSPKACFDDVKAAVAGEALMKPDTRLLRMIWESIYAQNADAEIASGMVTRNKLIQHITSLSMKADKNFIDELMETGSSMWRVRMREAALDHWRLDNNIGDDDWQSAVAHAHVVDNFLEPADLRTMFPDFEDIDKVIKKIGVADLSGVQLYEAIQKQLPESKRHKQIGEVHHPIYAQIYMPERVTEHIPHETAGVEPIATSLPTLPYIKKTVDDEQTKQIGEDILGLTKNALSQSGGRIVWKNIWIWLLPLGLLIFSFTSDLNNWLGLFIYAYALVTFFFFIFSLIPSFLYRQVLFAHLYCQPKMGLLLLNALRHCDLLRSVNKGFLVAEKSKFYAMQGNIGDAVELWGDYKENIDETIYYSELAQIYDEGGAFDDQIATLRKLYELFPHNDSGAIDLGISLLHYKKDAVSAEKILSSISEATLFEEKLAAYYFAQGLIRFLYKDYSGALSYYQRALEEAREMIKKEPPVLILIAQISGYAAISLLALGARDHAMKIMKLLSGSLRRHVSTRIIVKRFSLALQKK